MDNNLNIINKELIDKSIIIQDIGGLSTDIAVVKNRKVDDDKAQGFNLGVSESLEAIREEISENMVLFLTAEEMSLRFYEEK